MGALNPRLILFGAGAAVVVLAVLAYVAKRGLPALGTAINPLNPENIFISGADGVTQAITGDPSFGGWLHDVLNPGANAAMRAPVVIGGPPRDAELPHDAPPSDFFLGAP